MAATVAVLSFALGVAASHATLGKQVTRALTLLEPLETLAQAVASLDKRVTVLEVGDSPQLHIHRRMTDL